VNVTSKLKEIFVNIFSISPEIINDELSPDMVAKWDSLQHLNLILSIEEEFGIKIFPEEAVELLNFGLAIKHIEEKLSRNEKKSEFLERDV
jgi:acyl carrier protein